MYRNLNDYEIIYLVSDNNDNDYGIMYDKYTPLINKVINKYKFIARKLGYEMSDLYQIGYIGLLKAIRTYDIEKNIMFYTYALKVIENTVLNDLRDNQTLKKQVLNESISYDILIPNTNVSYIDMIVDNNSGIDYDDSLIIKYINFKNSLSFDLACILELRINGCSIDEINKLLLIPKNLIDKYIISIKSLIY